VKTALSFAFILITVLLFWVGIVQTKSENEKITLSVRQISTSLNLSNDENQSNSSSAEDLRIKKNIYPVKKRPVTLLPRQEMSTEKLLYRVKKTSGNKGITPLEALDMHRQVLDGKFFLKHLTEKIESTANAEKIILVPFSNQTIVLGNDALTRSLFSISQMDSNSSKAMEVSIHGKTPEAASLLKQLISRTHEKILEEESEQDPLLPSVAELAVTIQQKEENVKELRRQIQQRQSAKPVATVEEISLRAERDQCEKELAEYKDVRSTLKEARDKGASDENLAALEILSNKGNLADFSNTLKQLREFRNSPKAKNKAIRQELDHQISQAMKKLGTELEQVRISLDRGYSKTLKRRDEVRAELVAIIKVTSSESKSNQRFQLLEKREQEVISLQKRYDFQMARWRDAKGLLVEVNGKKNGPN
tara:strand:- start:1464 stop:2726 length:1263 start_codon:yes stop_codon:yes gene_type:complete